LDKALDLLVKPTCIENQRGIKLSTATADKGPFLAFNILSVGLDAFVTCMTNKMKGRLPGDSYKLWVDIAALLYDRIYHVGPMDVRVLDHNSRELDAFSEKVLFLAVGASGHRTYGSNKKVLPDNRNICVACNMHLWKKLALKGLFMTGRHVDRPEFRLWTASRVEFTGRFPILAQLDGETALLDPADFPAVIEVTEPAIPVLVAKKQS
jgi:diacylglycerol kinase family enzyme